MYAVKLLCAFILTTATFKEVQYSKAIPQSKEMKRFKFNNHVQQEKKSQFAINL